MNLMGYILLFTGDLNSSDATMASKGVTAMAYIQAEGRTQGILFPAYVLGHPSPRVPS